MLKKKYIYIKKKKKDMTEINKQKAMLGKGTQYDSKRTIEKKMLHWDQRWT